MAIELDHIICFVEPAFPEEKTLIQAGFRFAPARIHPGQGTSNRCILFERSYIEFLWIHAPDEARMIPLRLEERAAARGALRGPRAAGVCPFGLSFRGKPRELGDDADFDLYSPPYSFPGRIFVWRVSVERLDVPLVLLFDTGDIDFRPRVRFRGSPELFDHPSGSRDINLVQVECAGGSSWPLAFSKILPFVEVKAGSSPSLNIHLTGGPPAPVIVSPLVRLSGPPSARARGVPAGNR